MIKIVIGIDIGGTNTVFGAVNLEGDILIESSMPTNLYDNINDYLNHLSKAIDSVLNSISFNYKLIGIGIGAPNGNIYKGTIEYAPNLKWRGSVDFVKLFKKYYNVPMALTNDANAAALGEMMYGGAKNMKNFIEVTLGTGLGSGFVVNKKIIYGHNGFAGELGHISVDIDGRLCACGRKGCLETYASASGIKRTVLYELRKSNKNSLLRNIKAENLRSKDIYIAATKNDKIALNAFDFTGKILGLKLADAVAITEPEAIFLFGGLALSGDYILKPTLKYFEKFLLPIYKGQVNILLSELNNRNAAVLGAAALILTH